MFTKNEEQLCLKLMSKINHKLIYFQRSSSKNDFLPSLNKTVDLLSFIFLHGIGPYYKNFLF